ncbi:MAG: DUF1570 domain-containing protein [Asticcacaulis sp.]|nr:DUF1570 domain-containing protein [Asticcacaulis sp.]
MGRVLKCLAGVWALAIAVATPAFAGDTWVRAESDHFIVYSNAKAKAAEGYAKQLEQYRYVLGAMYDMADDTAPEPKLNVYFVDSVDNLKQAFPRMPSGVLGFVKPCAGGMNAYAYYDGDRISHDKVTAQEENFSQTVIFHEYAHQFMFLHSQDAYPRWFMEGFAEYYATTAIQGDQALVGMAWSERVYQLMDDRTSLNYEAMLRDDWEVTGKMDDFHAKSWLLAHWILSDPKRTKTFFAYVDARNAGEDPVAGFQKAFGLDMKQLKHTLNDYLAGKDLKATVFRIDNMPAPAITVTTLPPAADNLAIWDSVASTCPVERKSLLDKITAETAKYPGDDYAMGVKARADIMIGDEALALDYYRARTTAHPGDADSFFWLGLTQYLMAEHGKLIPGETKESQIKLARRGFIQSYKLDATNPVNLYYLSRTAAYTTDYPDDASLNAAIEAHMLSPSITTYAFNAANMLLLKGRLTDARDTLVPLANDPHGGDEAGRIAKIIKAIDDGATKDEAIELLRKLNEPDPTEDAAPAAPEPKK